MSIRNPLDTELPHDSAEYRCNTCGEVFSSTYALSQHRTADGNNPEKQRCLTVAEMQEKGFTVSAPGDYHPPLWRLLTTTGLYLEQRPAGKYPHPEQAREKKRKNARR